MFKTRFWVCHGAASRTGVMRPELIQHEPDTSPHGHSPHGMHGPNSGRLLSRGVAQVSPAAGDSLPSLPRINKSGRTL